MDKKVILVTGGSSGIGESICKVLAAKGHIVYGTSRNASGAKTKDGYYLVSLDVENELSVQNCIKSIINREGRINVLINNAGVGIMGSVEDCSDDEIYKAFNINVFGLIRTTREVLPFMRNQNTGLIINVASIAGYMGLPYRAFYSATKSSVQKITEALRIEVETYGIKACVIDPGDFNTNISGNRVVAEKVRNGTSVYTDETIRIENMINSEINKSLNSDMIGDVVLKIINTKNPKVYYRVGKLMQKISIQVRAFLGADVFEKILKNHFKIQ